LQENKSYTKRIVTGKRNVGRRNGLFLEAREKEDHGRRKLQKEPPVSRRHSIRVKS